MFSLSLIFMSNGSVNLHYAIYTYLREGSAMSKTDKKIKTVIRMPSDLTPLKLTSWDLAKTSSAMD
jgi:hypothetical protein